MMELIPEIMDLNSMRVSAIVRQKVESGDLIREEIKRKAYFTKA